jgi:pteridine reductase
MARKVALITGGAKRVGRAVGLKLARAGWDVAFTVRRSAKDASSLLSEIAEFGGTALAIPVDLTRPVEAVRSIAERYTAMFDRLDLLIHNASVFPRAGLEETSPEMLREVLAIHVETPLLLTQRFAPMLRKSHGLVVSMTDLAAEKPFKSYLAYSASKAALSNLTTGLARALAPEARAVSIAPGAVEFPDDMPAGAREAYLAKVPLGRVGTPQDVAELVHFLTTAGSYITGTTIRLDGGRGAV